MATRSTGVGWRLRRAWLLLAMLAGVGLSCDGPVSEQHIGTAPVDVPPEVYRELMAAESHGRYFHQHVRNKSYRYQRLD